MYAGIPGVDEMSLLFWSSRSELFKYTLVTLGHFKNEYIFSPEKELGKMELDVPMASMVLPAPRAICVVWAYPAHSLSCSCGPGMKSFEFLTGVF